MTVESTITALQALTKSFATDDEPDFDAFIRINAEIETLMPTLDLTRAEAIATQLAALEVIVQQKYTDLKNEISQLGPKRRAMKGYGHLRSHTRGQRIVKDVRAKVPPRMTE